MTTPEFKPGDLVRLKSGGPLMTVSVLMDSGRIACLWFGDSKEMIYGRFSAKCLDPISIDNRPLPQL
jgi:uncharacterized protein YodC (DUF2158 family)